MFHFRPVLFVLCAMMASCAANPNADDPAPNVVADVRLMREHLKSQQIVIRSCRVSATDTMLHAALEESFCEHTLGEQRTFAACAFMLTNQPSDQELAGVLLLLSRRKGDRGQFIPHALQALRHTNEWVRTCAVTLLGKIGTPNELPALRAMLADADAGVIIAVAEAFASIGGPDDLIAVNRWLAGSGRDFGGDGGYTGEVVAQHRDKLKARLVENRQWPAEEKK